ncbi:DUF4004 family protein [Bacillus suaedaesalsae]|uniref:DUF4004 family protein n=1 Tax=Bacillus suaedaesalsae TaxID=2810349 RepID=A0ABS2DFQ9_9BACI|nr:DUF4004 family protein [Bacillus suaedaesalsae]MBM6616860.1 DUF4004 family protein [Bacillus suaedaesalsae]
MEETFISKKELLERTGISYGQLYRWKRMNIIPENWFIKKSSFTGQETYFPRDKVLERINKIVELKDDYSLEELAKFFSPNATDVEVMIDDLSSYHIISEKVLNASKQSLGKELVFMDVFYLYMCDWLAKEYTFSLETLLQQLTFIKKADHKAEDLELVAIRKNSETIWLVVSSKDFVLVEDNASVLVKVNLVEKMNEVKIKLSEAKE